MKQINSRIQLKVDSAANWTSSNPTLLMGEVGFESDTGRYKVGDGATSWVSLEYKNEKNTIKLVKEHSEAIVDVLELPTEDIDEKKFYRKQTAVWVYNQFVHNRWKCYIVENLPEVGENVIEGDINDEANVMVTAYYNMTDQTPYAYVNDATGSAFGIPGGWYPASVFISAIQYSFGGVITDISDCVEGDTFYLLLDTELFSYKDKWISHRVVGRHGTGSSAEVFNHESNIASGPVSHAEGQNTQATNYSAHAEGRGSIASGKYSHAEGNHSHAEGECSHAEGNYSHAEGTYSHSEGSYTIARGLYSHAGGWHTVAGTDSQTTIGQYNKENADALFIVGNGNGRGGDRNETNCSNAFEVLKDGRAKSFGTPSEDNDLVTVDYVSNALSNLNINVDLSDYATKDYVDTEIEELNLSSYATETYVNTQIAALVDSAPEALNTLGELAIALNNHEDAYDALLETVGGKVDKITGKQLSTNDFTNAYKSQLDSLKNFQETDPTVPSWAKQANKPTYTAAEVGALPSTTTLANLATDSTHRTVTDAEKDTWNKKSNFSGNYNDLTNKPAPVDLSGYYTKTEVDNQIKALNDRLDALKIYDYSYDEN